MLLELIRNPRQTWKIYNFYIGKHLKIELLKSQLLFIICNLFFIPFLIIRIFYYVFSILNWIFVYISDFFDNLSGKILIRTKSYNKFQEFFQNRYVDKRRIKILNMIERGKFK